MSSLLQLVEDKIEIFCKKYYLALIIICGVSISLKIYFTPFNFPLESQDALIFLHQAKQLAVGKSSCIYAFTIFAW